MGAPTSMKAHEQTAISTILHPPKVWEEFLDETFALFLKLVFTIFYQFFYFFTE